MNEQQLHYAQNECYTENIELTFPFLFFFNPNQLNGQ